MLLEIFCALEHKLVAAGAEKLALKFTQNQLTYAFSLHLLKPHRWPPARTKVYFHFFTEDYNLNDLKLLLQHYKNLSPTSSKWKWRIFQPIRTLKLPKTSIFAIFVFHLFSVMNHLLKGYINYSPMQTKKKFPLFKIRFNIFLAAMNIPCNNIPNEQMLLKNYITPGLKNTPAL